MDLLGLQNVQGRVRAHEVWGEEDSSLVWTPKTEFKKNLVLNQWATIVAKLLTAGDARYRIGGMYLEFENVASPGDIVSAPTFDRTRDVTYYDDLSGSVVRDYLRVPMTANQLLTDGTGFNNNQIVFFARSSGTTGVHGKTFSDSVNSTIFGASLVAFISNNDATQDLLLSSFYFDVADQQQKLATSQVGIEWEFTLQ
jgi:hypothetical protein